MITLMDFSYEETYIYAHVGIYLPILRCIFPSGKIGNFCPDRK
jgi:hypothetical protein